MKTRTFVTILILVLAVLIIVGSCISSMSMVDRTPDKFEIHYTWIMFADWFNDQLQILDLAANRTLEMGYDYFYLWNLGCDETVTDTNGTLVSSRDPVKAIERSYGQCPMTSPVIFLVEPVNKAKYNSPPHNAQDVKQVVRETIVLRRALSGRW